MRITKLLFLTLFLPLMLIACQGEDNEPEVVPTLANADVDSDSSARATLTPLPTHTPFPTLPGRGTLPPSWTPSPTGTSVPPTPTETQPPTDPPRFTPESCEGFAPDFQNSVENFTLGESPVIAWREVEAAALYRIIIFDEQERTLLTEFTEEEFFNVPAPVFTQAGRYGWQIEPLDSIGIQICPSRGEVLRAQEP